MTEITEAMPDVVVAEEARPVISQTEIDADTGELIVTTILPVATSETRYTQEWLVGQRAQVQEQFDARQAELTEIDGLLAQFGSPLEATPQKP